MKNLLFVFFSIISSITIAQSPLDSLPYEVIILEYEYTDYHVPMYSKDSVLCESTYVERPFINSFDTILIKDFEAFGMYMFPSFQFMNDREQKPIAPLRYGLSLSTKIKYQSKDLLSILVSEKFGPGGCYGGSGSTNIYHSFSYYIPEHKILTLADVVEVGDIYPVLLELRAMKKNRYYDDADEYETEWRKSRIFCNLDEFYNRPISISTEGITFFYDENMPGRAIEGPIYMEFKNYRSSFQPWILELMSID